jgi:formiminoglutamate deiminase
LAVYWCELAWLGGFRAEPGVVVEVEGERIAGISRAATPPPGSERLAGLAIPGLVNAHSHAFQRLLRGRVQVGSGSFWSWRDRMYDLAQSLDPESYLAAARAAFGEMSLAGITLVGEFHYLHHAAGGRPYAEPNEMANALALAAAAVGVRLTLIDACYLEGGIGRPAEGAQLRFCDRDAEAWAARMQGLQEGKLFRVAGAVHSVRAVPPDAARTVAAWASNARRPFHAHVSEQPAENDACFAAYGRSPTQVLEDAGALAANFTAVHATHLADEDFRRLGAAAATCCLCPTTERDLADGIAPGRRLEEAGVRLSLGSDSNAIIDLFEEARAVELDQRLATNFRGSHDPRGLLAAATAGGATSLGWPETGVLASGALADLAVVGLDSVRLAGAEASWALPALVFAGSAADVRDVMVGGRWIVRGGAHLELDVAAELRSAFR